MKYYIYQTTNLINGKFYVGVHKTYPLKFDNYIGSGQALKHAIKKYGRHNFKCISLIEFDHAEQAYMMEKLIVNEEFVKREDTYNLVIGGNGARQRFSSGRPKGCVAHNKGKKLEEIVGVERACIIKQNLSFRRKNNNSGYKHSKETKEKIGKSNTKKDKIPKALLGKKGERNSQYGKKWIMNHELQQNKKCSQEEYEFYISNGWVCGFKFSYIQSKEQL